MTVSITISTRWADISTRAQLWAIRTGRIATDQWDLIEDGYVYDTITADDADDALASAKECFDRSAYDSTTTTWVDIEVRNPITEETGSETIQIDPEEPECESEALTHDWRAPLILVGGISENPGVWGHGGGVICKKACIRCGAQRLTDSWAQRPDTGEQGLRSVSYEAAGHYDLAPYIRRRIDLDGGWDHSFDGRDETDPALVTVTSAGDTWYAVEDGAGGGFGFTAYSDEAEARKAAAELARHAKDLMDMDAE